MKQSRELFLKISLFVLVGVFCLPTVLYGGYLVYCWIRVHTSSVYYTDYRYGNNVAIFLGAAVISLFALWTGTVKKGFSRLLLAIPIIVGVAAMIFIPEATPRNASLGADANYVSMMGSSLHDWYQEKGRFPASEEEFKDAMAKGAAAWQKMFGDSPTSGYLKDGEVVPYEVTVEKNANGPRVNNVSQRPGMVHYCVSQDLQEYWLTMTELQGDFGTAATIKRIGAGPHDEVLVLHASGKDYSAEKQ
jgi:hypothetical protein